MSQNEDRIVGCLSSWASELNARCDRVRQLIGPKHWLSDGRQKEHILAEFLRRHLPERFRVASGFICPHDPEVAISGEIDLLVVDALRDAPWFKEGPLIITPPAGVLAQIHVKTTFGKTEFIDVIKSIRGAYRAIETSGRVRKVWSGGFFFVDGQQTRLEDLVPVWISEAFDNGDNEMEYLPDCLAVLGGPIMIFSKGERVGVFPGTEVKVFHGDKFAAAVFLANMIDHLQVEVDKERFMSALTQLVARLGLRHLFSTKVGGAEKETRG